ncbi:MAG: hypothetical protein M1813_000420 [Trichoglossum hirsutum]|nr:MAG: hypothetical protein M1813_000420 [Trichoglossum hirsutum]
MDHTSTRPPQRTPSPKSAASSQPVAPTQAQQRPLPNQQAVHTIVHKSPEGSGKGVAPYSSFSSSPRYTGSPVDSELYSPSPRSHSSAGSPYLMTPPIVEGDELAPFKPDKEDQLRLSTHEGAQSRKNEEAQRPLNREGHPLQVPTTTSLRRRSGWSCRIISHPESRQYNESVGHLGAKHNEESGESGESKNSPYVLPSPTLSSPPLPTPIRDDNISQGSITCHSPPLSPLTSPHLSTLVRDDYINRSQAKAASSGPMPAQGTPSPSQRNKDNFPLHKASFDHRWSIDYGAISMPSFRTTLNTLYTQKNSAWKESRRDKNGEATGARTKHDYEGNWKHSTKANRLTSAPDTPAIITPRRASSVGRQVANGKLSVGNSVHVSLERQDGLRESIISSFLPAREHLGRKPKVRSSSELHPPFGRSGSAGPVTTHITFRQVNVGADDPLRESSLTIQNVQSGSSMYEVIWRSDNTPSDFTAKVRDARGSGPLAKDLTDSSGTCCSIRSGSGKSSDYLDFDFLEPERAPGWSWTGPSRRDATGACVQFGFEPRVNSIPRQKDCSSGSPTISSDPTVFIESFPSLPERKSTLEWETPNDARVGGAFTAKAGGGVGQCNQTAPTTPTTEYALDPLTRDRCPDRALSVPDLLDLTHDSPRDRQSCRSSVQPHPGARPRTAEQPKMGFALGISAGLRRSKSNSSSLLTRALTPPLRCRSTLWSSVFEG